MAPPRSKRIDQDAHTAMGSNGAGRSDGGPQSVPTPETQELYNLMRQREEELSELTLSDRLQIQNGTGSNDEHADLLRPPTPSQGPTSPRSPSCASTTHSLSRALDDVEIDDEEPSKKRRAIRHGPLEPLKRARAAFMRKVGACQECKTRRVKVRSEMLPKI